MNRREVVAGLGLMPLPFSARGEAPPRVYRIGWLRIGSPPPSFIEPFRQGLRELGYVEGQNLAIEFGSAATAEQLPATAAALVRTTLDLLFASGAAAVLPARDAAGGLPIVFVAGIDPVATGIAAGGLARPGPNVTGVTTVQIDLTAKRMQLLKEMLPSLAAVAFLVRESNPGRAEYVSEAERAARSLGLRFHVVSATGARDLDDAFRAARQEGAGAVVPMDESAFTAERRRLVGLAERYALPGVYPIREFVAEGGLISLGPKYEDIYRRAATLVDRILKGTKPADLPVEQPTKFEIAVNLRAAKALGLTISPALLARADEVIE